MEDELVLDALVAALLVVVLVLVGELVLLVLKVVVLPET